MFRQEGLYAQFLLSQMAKDLGLVGNARGRHMHSYGASVEDVWLSNALSIYSVPKYWFDLPR